MFKLNDSFKELGIPKDKKDLKKSNSLSFNGGIRELVKDTCDAVK